MKLILLNVAALLTLLPWLAVLVPTVMMGDSGSPGHIARLKGLFVLYFSYPVVVVGACLGTWVARWLGHDTLAGQLAWMPWVVYGAILVVAYVAVLMLWS